MEPQSLTPREIARRRRIRDDRRVTYALKVTLLVLLVGLLARVAFEFLARVPSAATVVIGALFFTYAVYPLVRLLSERYPRWVAIAIVYLGVALLTAFALGIVLPPLLTEAQALPQTLPNATRNVQLLLAPDRPIVRHLPPQVRIYLLALPAKLIAAAQGYAGTAATGVLGLLLSTLSILGTTIAIPIVAAYMMLEAESLRELTLSVVPPRRREKTLEVARDLDRLLGGFIRGQLLVGATVGTCIAIMLLIVHVRFAVTIGVMAGLFDVIPYIGAVVGFVPSVLLAFFDDGWQHAGVVGICFAVIFQLEGQFIAPRIVSGSVGLSPLMVIVAILVGGELGGIFGMFLAVPVAGILRVLATHFVRRRPISPLAAGGTLADELADA